MSPAERALLEGARAAIVALSEGRRPRDLSQFVAQIDAALSQPPAPPRDPRFVVVADKDACKDGWHFAGCEGFDHHHWELYDTATTPPTLVGADGGEPEDQLLVRDWRWVAEALNRVAGEGDQGVEARVVALGGNLPGMAVLTDVLSNAGFKPGDLVRVVLVKRKEG